MPMYSLGADWAGEDWVFCIHSSSSSLICRSAKKVVLLGSAFQYHDSGRVVLLMAIEMDSAKCNGHENHLTLLLRPIMLGLANEKF